ncbi:MAG: alkaline phosphatase family protein [Deltaproteobacteria bacterium]|nr:alkaline phosphatase family protein [Deltaproteobacteria bacterium]
MFKGKIYVIGVDQMVLPLTMHFIEEGSLPTLAKLFARSSYGQALASFPCWTPNNWAGISTGAQSGTHGASSWFIRMPDGEDVSSLTSLGINAETIWEAAERQGLKSAVLHYPGSMPSRLKKGYIIDGNAGPAYNACPFELAAAEAYASERNIESNSLKEIIFKPAEGWKDLPSGGQRPLAASLPVSAKYEEWCTTWQILALGGDQGYDRVVICREKDFSTSISECRLNQWSEWATVSIGGREGGVRFKLTTLSPNGKSIKLYRSQIMPYAGFSDPDEIGTELIKAIGPYQEYVSQMFNVLGILDYKTCVEEADYQGQWIATAALYLTQKKGCDVFFSHWHFLDDVNHFHLAHLDPTWIRYDKKESEKHWDMVRQAYQAIDHMVATVVEGVTEDDCVIVVSDHGCSSVNRKVSMELFLKERGFLVMKDPKDTPSCFVRGFNDRVDMEKTKVWLHEGVFMDPFNIYINTKNPEEYKTIQRDLIRELRTWVDDKLHQTPVAMALSKQDAEMIGLWGDQVGDVVVVLETGYTLAKKIGETALEDNMGQIASGHGRIKPTSETKFATEKAMFSIAAPGIKKGYVRPVEKLGHMRLIDVTPTLCHMLGIQPPAQSQGSVIYDVFEGNEMVRNRPDPTPAYGPTKEYKERMQGFIYDFGILKDESNPC